MGLGQSKAVEEVFDASNEFPTIVGIGTEWPECLIGPEELERYARRYYGFENPGINRLIKTNQCTGIKTRATLDLWKDARWNQETPPTADDLDEIYRLEGVKLALGASLKAIREWGGNVSDITHVVAVTATNAGSPGYDQLLAHELGISTDAERLLISGIGCAGGLAALRTAASLSDAATFQKKPARVLVVALEVTSIQVRCELDAASKMQQPCIGPALFGDGSAALVLCNSYAMPASPSKGIYSLCDRKTTIVPGTHSAMRYRMTTLGFLLELSKDVPLQAAMAVKAQMSKLPGIRSQASDESLALKPQDFDWALHPGGKAVIQGVQQAVGLSTHHLRASWDIYQNRGNTSSVAVLAVLDRLRNMGPGRKNVLAFSFGPGLTVEMARLIRLVP